MSKDLVNAIIDGEEDAKALASRAGEIGKTLAERLTAAAKALASAILDGRLTEEKARKMWRLFYVQLVLVGFIQVAQEVRDVATSAHGAVKAAGEGVDKTKVGAIRSADKKARANERHGSN